MQKTKSNKQVVVLGQRRSGTSMVSGILHKLGVSMGKEEDVSHTSDRNPHGFYEDLEIVRLSERIVEYVKENPSCTFARIEARFEDEIKEIIKNREGLWGFKDVNQLQTHRLWRKHLTNPYYLVVMRNPIDIALSLQSWRKDHQNKDIHIYNFLDVVFSEYSVLMQNLKTIREPTMLLNYERIRNEPEKMVSDVVNFLELNPSEEQKKEALNHIK